MYVPSPWSQHVKLASECQVCGFCEAIPIRPVPGKIRHSNLVFYFRELVKCLVTVTVSGGWYIPVQGTAPRIKII